MLPKPLNSKKAKKKVKKEKLHTIPIPFPIPILKPLLLLPDPLPKIRVRPKHAPKGLPRDPAVLHVLIHPVRDAEGVPEGAPRGTRLLRVSRRRSYDLGLRLREDGLRPPFDRAGFGGGGGGVGGTERVEDRGCAWCGRASSKGGGALALLVDVPSEGVWLGSRLGWEGEWSSCHCCVLVWSWDARCSGWDLVWDAEAESLIWGCYGWGC